MAADPDVVHRAKAAAALAGRDIKDVADEVGMDYSTLRRQLIGGPRQRPHEREGLLAKLAQVCELPVEFFSVDFSRLPEIADDDELGPRARGYYEGMERAINLTISVITDALRKAGVNETIIRSLVERVLDGNEEEE